MLGVGSSMFMTSLSRLLSSCTLTELAALQPSAARPCSPVGFRAGLVGEDFDFGWCGMGEFVHL